MQGFRWCVTLALAGLGLFGASTEVWKQSAKAEFEKGLRKGVAVSSDGRLTLAPAVRELKDAGVPYLWAAVEDARGSVYFAGAGRTPGKTVVMEGSNGQFRDLAEIEGFEVHALALNGSGDLFAATSPDGKVWRVGRDGRVTEYYDPKSKYIWAMVFDAAGNLFVGTGDKGQVHRVTPNGQGSVLVETQEKHARSLALDGKGQLLVGTEPGGLILRVDGNGQAFVLHQAGRQEVTSLVTAPDGTVYAAASGNRAGGPASTGPIVSTTTMTVSGTPSPAAANTAAPRPATPAPNQPQPFTAPSGGSELWMILPDGEPRLVWSDAREIVYAVALDSLRRPVLGTGNSGNLYRIDSPVQWSLLPALGASQVTGLAPGRNGRLLAVTASSGRLYEIGPELESSGTIESEVYDSESFSTWGRIAVQGEANSGAIGISARSGNLDQTSKHWSPWQDVALNEGSGRIEAPAARFVQYRLTLRAPGSGSAGSGSAASPEVRSVEVAYRPKNLAPVIRQIEVTPPNFRFPAPTPLVSGTRSLSLPPIGQARTQTSGSGGSGGSPTLTFSKGSQSVRWSASDANEDDLLFRVEIRGVQESVWKLIRDEVKESFATFDSTADADGRYVIRVIATDRGSNPVGEEQTSQIESEPFVVDNSAPRVTGWTHQTSGGRTTVTWKASDLTSNLNRVEVSVNGGDWRPVLPAGRVLDWREHDFTLTVPRTPELVIAVRAEDEFENQVVEKLVIR
jgi:hypothetical protein